MVAKGFLRTAEALVAMAVMLIFLVFFFPGGPITQESVPQEDILTPLRTDVQFRACVLARDGICINNTIDERLEDRYQFRFNITTDATQEVAGLPEEAVAVNTLYIAGNFTQNDTVILRVFYWPRG